MPCRHRAEVAELKTMLHVAHTIAGFTRTVGPTMLRAPIELHAVETTDAALRSGRKASRRLRRDYAGFAALPGAEVRAFVRNGFRSHARDAAHHARVPRHDGVGHE